MIGTITVIVIGDDGFKRGLLFIWLFFVVGLFLRQVFLKLLDILVPFGRGRENAGDVQGLEVFSEKYKIGGKIDIYDLRNSLLTERKKKIKVIYDGYVFQLYAQYFCLTEMGYNIEKIMLYSMDDNKSYPIEKPEDDGEMFEKFESLISEMTSFSLGDKFETNINKCRHCIYNTICDVSAC